MSHARRKLLLLTVLAASAGCGGPDHAPGVPAGRARAGTRRAASAARPGLVSVPTPGPDTVVVPRPGPAGVAVILRELAAIGPEPVTADAWLRAHAGDVAHSLGPDEADPLRGAVPPCLRAVAAWRDAEGHTLTRSALFYAPPAVDPLPPLPASVDPALARSGCRLGAIAVTVTGWSADGATALVDSVHGAHSRAFGAPETTNASGYWASSAWRRFVRWRRGDVRTAAAVVRVPAAAEGERPTYALAFAHRPSAHVGQPIEEVLADPDLPVYDDVLGSDRDREVDGEFERALRLAAAPDSVAAPLRALFAEARRDDVVGLAPAADGVVAARVAEPLRRWLAATRDLPTPRRAAALVAADAILSQGRVVPSRTTEPPEDSGAVVRALTAIGADYEYVDLGAAYLYGGNWRREARAIDPDGPGGELALLGQLRQGFLEPKCRLDVDLSASPTAAGAAGMEAFRAVIAEGERLLPRLRDDSTRARVHAQVGDAWRDVVALAGGRTPYVEYADSLAYRGEAPAARERAVAHYRDALAAIAAANARTPGAPSPWWARRAWRDAWWLLAGLTPTSARYFCVYD